MGKNKEESPTPMYYLYKNTVKSKAANTQRSVNVGSRNKKKSYVDKNCYKKKKQHKKNLKIILNKIKNTTKKSNKM